MNTAGARQTRCRGGRRQFENSTQTQAAASHPTVTDCVKHFVGFRYRLLNGRIALAERYHLRLHAIPNFGCFPDQLIDLGKKRWNQK